MKSIRPLFALLLFALVAAVGFVHGAGVASVCLLAGSAALLAPAETAGQLLTVTLTPALLLQQTIRQVFVRHPAMGFFAGDFTTERVKKGQTVTGKIRIRPTVAQYDADQGGYKNGAQDTRDLLVDVPFVMDQHAHITLKLSHLDALTDSMMKMDEHIQDSASVLGAAMVRYALGKVHSRSFSNDTIYTAANSNKDALNAVRKAMNLRGVGEPRFGIVNSDVAEALEGDARITNRYDNNSKETDIRSTMRLRGVAGFQEIVEDPALDDLTAADTLTITGEADTEVITTSEAHGLAVNDRVQIAGLTGGTGIEAGYFFVKTAPSTTTLTLSATRGGAVAAFSTDITDGTLKQAENLSGFFFGRGAVAIKTALPADSLEAARAIGIPVPASSEVVMDPDSGLAMLLYKWFEPGTMDAYVTATCLYGATAGALADSNGYAMEPSGELLRIA